MLQLETDRLRLLPLSSAAIDALLAGDGRQLRELTGATFPTPVRPPPLTEQLLPMVRDRLSADAAQEGWWTWVVIRKDTREAVGSVGFGGGPDAEGAVMVGYATYPNVERRGYATEAAAALVDWALEHHDVLRVCASMPPDNAAAIRVAQKVGMRLLGTVWEEDLDDVLLYGIERP
ncbi:MAG TPA: GNAT family N-acetyltransferase [Gemmatimonadales bacterium]|jgi:ribosomal-protein-alanine N-acetyltransferase|nr:GNAT family N-acetyltransferase [Gemmatimonadales bacterium]